MSEGKKEKTDYEKARTAAENLYIESGMDGRAIASLLSVSEVTVSRWKKEDEWEEKKRFLKVTPSYLRMKLLEEAKKVVKGETSTVNADAVSKLLSAAEKMAGKITPDVIHAVLKECCTHISTIDPKASLQMAKYHRMFLQHKIEKEG